MHASVPGARLMGTIELTSVDAEVAKLQEPHAGQSFKFHVVEVEPMRKISGRTQAGGSRGQRRRLDAPMRLVEKYLVRHPGL